MRGMSDEPRRNLPILNAPAVEPPELFGAFTAAYERMRIAGGLQFAASVNVRAMAELLLAKGIITEEEMRAAQQEASEEEERRFREAGMSVQLAAYDISKYDLPAEEYPGIDCEARIPQCKAACCTMRWVLTEEDVLERAVQWDLEIPYTNRLGADGWCVHCDPETKGCGVYHQRPLVCRTYDCRGDSRIWSDFEAREINPNLFDEDGRVRRPMGTDMPTPDRRG